ncbi:MAG TPA: hypothetical protein VIX63_04040 [Vicinamibacterales bacterium]
MDQDNPLSDRGRGLEEDYFRKRDRELIEKMRSAVAADEARRELATKTGLQDPEMLQELQALGFTPDTVVLLPLVPLVQMAWAEGGVSEAERKLIVQLARARGIAEGSAADRQLSAWLSTRPAPDVFTRASRLIQAMLDAPAGDHSLSADDLVKYCENIAAASGGILGINRVSAEERALLNTIARDLKARQS